MPSPASRPPLKIAHVVPSFFPAHVYGGPIRSVYALCNALARLGCEVRVLTTNTNGPKAVLPVDTSCEHRMGDGIAVRYCARRLRQSVSPELLHVLPNYVRWADLVHLTAVYNFTTFPTLVTARRHSKPLVWSPRGALQRWSGSRHSGVKSLWEMITRGLAPEPLVLHLTSEQERLESLEKFPAARAEVIPNGIEIPAIVVHQESSDTLRLLFLGRLDPKKGIENLLDACARLDFPWTLIIAGGGEDAYLRSSPPASASSASAGRRSWSGKCSTTPRSASFSRPMYAWRRRSRKISRSWWPKRWRTPCR
jgi:glycosyltransferase involved in cell wall biosynthesis